jgi:hypothetical protein
LLSSGRRSLKKKYSKSVCLYSFLYICLSAFLSVLPLSVAFVSYLIRTKKFSTIVLQPSLPSSGKRSLKKEFSKSVCLYVCISLCLSICISVCRTLSVSSLSNLIWTKTFSMKMPRRSLLSFKERNSVSPTFYLSVCLHLFLFHLTFFYIYHYVCLSISIFVCLDVCLSNSATYKLTSPNLTYLVDSYPHLNLTLPNLT